MLYTANKKLSDMTTELSKAQEHARRFQELLMTERRKQKSLKVLVIIIGLSYSIGTMYVHLACFRARAGQERDRTWHRTECNSPASICRYTF